MNVKCQKSLIAVVVTLFVSGGASAASIINLTQQTKPHPVLSHSHTMPSAGSANSQPQVTLDSKTSYRVVSEVKFKNGKTKYRLQQYYGDIPVYNSTLVADQDSFKNIINRPVIGSAVNGIQQDYDASAPSISEQQAFKISAANHDESKSVSDINRLNHKSSKFWVYLDGDQPHLIYETSFLYQNGNSISRPVTLVDAHSGKVFKTWNSMENELIGTGSGGNPNTGEYQYGDSKKHPKLDLKVVNTGSGKECIFDTPHVRTVDLHNTQFTTGDKGQVVDNPTEQYNDQPVKYDCSQSTDHQEQEINGGYGITNDAHYFGTVIYNMYEQWFNQSPLQALDKTGKVVDYQLLMRVHYGHNFNNAFWDGQEMNFGDGGPVIIKKTAFGVVVSKKKVDDFYPFVTLDVTAHEVSHGFTQLNSGLQGGHSKVPGTACEACSINEAFSDMAGEAAKNFAYGSNDFETGAAIIKDPQSFGSNSIRSLKNPSQDNHTVDTEPQYQQMIQDSINNKTEVDEHAGAGIYDKAFYELATTNGWSTQSAFEVFVNANKLYWKKNTTFDNGACGVIQAAKDNASDPKDQQQAMSAVKHAFDAVEVDYSQCEIE